jgi:hypothetical protein
MGEYKFMREWDGSRCGDGLNGSTQVVLVIVILSLHMLDASHHRFRQAHYGYQL